MKSMGALDIEADVTRVIPAPADDPEHRAYDEYCAFTKDTGLYNLFFSKPGSYQKLISMPGVREGDTWTEEDIFALRKTYNAFRTAYDALVGDKKPVPVGDAFLTWLSAFDYREILKDDAGYHKRDLLGANSGRLPVGQSFDIRLCDPLAVTVPQDRFQDHPDRDRQTAHIRYPGFF